MKTPTFFAILMALALLPLRADAQQMQLQIQDGRVTLDAQNVPVRQILAEWARVGGAKIVNGEKVMGAPLTLELHGVPERQALDIILRGVSGYMLAARQVGTGVSAFDRIMILPTSTPPRASAPAQATFGNPGMNRGMPAQPMPVQAEPVEEIVEDGNNDDPEPEEEPNEGEGEPSDAQPQPQPTPNVNRFQRRGAVLPNPMGAQVQPFLPQSGGVQVFPGQQPVNGVQPGVQPGTTNPFGIPAGATTTPGVISPVPQQQNGTQPGITTTRPPGVQ